MGVGSPSFGDFPQEFSMGVSLWENLWEIPIVGCSGVPPVPRKRLAACIAERQSPAAPHSSRSHRMNKAPPGWEGFPVSCNPLFKGAGVLFHHRQSFFGFSCAAEKGLFHFGRKIPDDDKHHRAFLNRSVPEFLLGLRLLLLEMRLGI